MKKLELFLESLMFNSRWLLAPFYLGLVFGICLLLVKFIKELIHMVPDAFLSDSSSLTANILSLVDVVLVANLLIIIIFAGYENFVSKIDTGDHEDRPNWMGKVDFSDLKIKLIGSIVAISGIELLKAFTKIHSDMSLGPEHAAQINHELGWMVGIHLTFVVSGVLFAIMDRMGHRH